MGYGPSVSRMGWCHRMASTVLAVRPGGPYVGHDSLLVTHWDFLGKSNVQHAVDTSEIGMAIQFDPIFYDGFVLWPT